MHEELLESLGAVCFEGTPIGYGVLVTDTLLLASVPSRDSIRTRDRTEVRFGDQSRVDAVCRSLIDEPDTGLQLALLELGSPLSRAYLDRAPQRNRITPTNGMSLLTIDIGRDFQAHHGRFHQIPSMSHPMLISDQEDVEAGWPVFSLDSLELIGITAPGRDPNNLASIQIVPFETIAASNPRLRALDLFHRTTRRGPADQPDLFIEEVELDSGDPEIRYPAVQLVQSTGGSGGAVPVETLGDSVGAGVSTQYTLEFWLSTQSEGVDYDGDRPGVTPPSQTVYPVPLRIEVWSEELVFQTASQPLTLEARGKTEKARFPITAIRQSARSRGQASVLIFVRTASNGGETPGELIAVFRFETPIGDTAIPQKLENAYLAPDWFGFTEKPQSSATVTLYVRSHAGKIQILSCIAGEPAWGAIEVSESEFFELTRQAYVDILQVSVASAAREASGKTLPLSEAYHTLVPIGFRLYEKLFFSAEEPLWNLGHRLEQSDLNDATLVIALDPSAGELIIPWGLLFDRPPPLSSGEFAPPSDRFWGLRFRLVVHPSVEKTSRLSPHQPLSLATLYGKHAQVPEQLKFLSALNVEHVPLKSRDRSVPEFASRTFDILHLFCHGHAEVRKELSEALLAEYRKYAAGLAGEPQQKADHYLQNGSALQRSYFEPEGGIVPLDEIKRKIAPSRTIAHLVLLSMCESAQMTCSGDGFVRFFLKRGAQAVVGTEGPTLWSLGRELDRRILTALVNEEKSIADAVAEAKRALVAQHALALIYTVYGDPKLRFRRPLPADGSSNLTVPHSP